jgi:hypothetical protein
LNPLEGNPGDVKEIRNEMKKLMEILKGLAKSEAILNYIKIPTMISPEGGDSGFLAVSFMLIAISHRNQKSFPNVKMFNFLASGLGHMREQAKLETRGIVVNLNFVPYSFLTIATVKKDMKERFVKHYTRSTDKKGLTSPPMVKEKRMVYTDEKSCEESKDDVDESAEEEGESEEEEKSDGANESEADKIEDSSSEEEVKKDAKKDDEIVDESEIDDSVDKENDAEGDDEGDVVGELVNQEVIKLEVRRREAPQRI